MGWFKKSKAPEVVDLSDMQKRGLLRKPVQTNEEGVADFSSSSYGNASSSSTTESNSSSSSGGMDFLGNLANAGTPSTPSPGPITSSLREARGVSSNEELSEVKIKVDDNDYRLNNLIEKVRELEEKLDRMKD